MKNILLTTALLISSFVSFGQEAAVTTDKEQYKFDEIIEVTFELNAKYDSLDLPDFKGFKVIGGPTKSSSTSIKFGDTTISARRTYQLRPIESGRLKIYSPTYFIDGNRIEAKPAQVNVAPSNLTVEELEEKKFREFIEDGTKPKGTTRIVLFENKGYIEIFSGIGWELYRRLTSEEIERFERIK